MQSLRRLQKSYIVRATLSILFILICIEWLFTSKSRDHVVLAGSPVFANLKATKSHRPSPAEAQAACDAHGFPVWRRPDRKTYDLIFVEDQLDWLEVRLHTLAAHVDYFVIIESSTTADNTSSLQHNRDRFAEFHDKIIYRSLADSTQIQGQHEREAFIQNAFIQQVFPSLAETAMEARAGDVLIVGNVDEIIRPETAQLLKYCDTPKRLTLSSQVHYYAYQWKSRGIPRPHPQATTIGESIAGTLLPNSLRNDLLGSELFASYARYKDKTTLWNAGWYCAFCFATIQEMQTEIAKASIRAHSSIDVPDPATIIYRVQHGIDIFDRAGEKLDLVDPVNDVPEYVVHQSWKKQRLGYLLERRFERYAEFTDGKSLVGDAGAV